MDLIQTRSFKLAINSKGDKNSSKVALLLPGRLDTKDYANFTSHLDYLADKGFFAVAFDPPGTWSSPGGIEIFTTTNYMKAVNELIGYFNNKPTLLLGHSMGGRVAILVGVTNPNVVGLITVNGSFEPSPFPNRDSIKNEAITSRRDLPPGTEKTSEQKEFNLPINYFKNGAQYDPRPALKGCRKPKLIFYSIHDKFMEPEEIKEIYRDLSEPKMIYQLDCAHDYRYCSGAIKEVNKITGQFIKNYL